MKIEEVASEIGNELLGVLIPDCPFLLFCISRCNKERVARLAEEITSLITEKTRAGDLMLASMVTISTFIADNTGEDQFEIARMIGEECPPMAHICLTATEKGTMEMIRKLKDINFKDVTIYDFVVATFIVATSIIATKAAISIEQLASASKGNSEPAA